MRRASTYYNKLLSCLCPKSLMARQVLVFTRHH